MYPKHWRQRPGTPPFRTPLERQITPPDWPLTPPERRITRPGRRFTRPQRRVTPWIPALSRAGRRGNIAVMGLLPYGDNLDILGRYLAAASVDLVYLDPPFNSAQTYNAFFQEDDGTK